MSLISRAEGHYSAVCDCLLKILGGRRLESSMLGSSERQLANAGLGRQPSSLVAVQTGMYETMFFPAYHSPMLLGATHFC